MVEKNLEDPDVLRFMAASSPVRCFKKSLDDIQAVAIVNCFLRACSSGILQQPAAAAAAAAAAMGAGNARDGRIDGVGDGEAPAESRESSARRQPATRRADVGQSMVWHGGRTMCAAWERAAASGRLGTGHEPRSRGRPLLSGRRLLPCAARREARRAARAASPPVVVADLANDTASPALGGSGRLRPAQARGERGPQGSGVSHLSEAGCSNHAPFSPPNNGRRRSSRRAESGVSLGRPLPAARSPWRPRATKPVATKPVATKPVGDQAGRPAWSSLGRPGGRPREENALGHA